LFARAGCGVGHLQRLLQLGLRLSSGWFMLQIQPQSH
jgi:hypothetical protein